jgi:hypothetical protein
VPNGAVSPLSPLTPRVVAGQRQLRYWLYASCCDRPQSEAEGMIESIVEVSRSRNSALGITGALIFTGNHFSQYIEGPADCLGTVRASIVADTRHADVRTIREGPAPRRIFAEWSLAYGTPSPAFDRLIVLARRLQGRSGELLLFEMLRKFTGHPLPTLARPKGFAGHTGSQTTEDGDPD